MEDHVSRRRVLAGLAGVAAAGLAGCTNSPSDYSAGAKEDNGMAVDLVDHELQRDDLGNATVDVLVENTGGEQIRYLEAQAVIYNAADERVGDGLANATNVRPGESVRFDVFTTVDYDVADRYTVDVRTSAV